MRLIKQGDIFGRHEGVIGIRKVMAHDQNPPVQQVVNSGIIPLLF